MPNREICKRCRSNYKPTKVKVTDSGATMMKCKRCGWLLLDGPSGPNCTHWLEQSLEPDERNIKMPIVREEDLNGRG